MSLPPQVFVTDTHLGVALEFAAGGELFDTVARAGKLPEIEARYFFQQLILGLEYCHKRVRAAAPLRVAPAPGLPLALQRAWGRSRRGIAPRASCDSAAENVHVPAQLTTYIQPRSRQTHMR